MKKSVVGLLIAMFIGAVGLRFVETEDAICAPGVKNITQRVWWTFSTVSTGDFEEIHNPEANLARLLTMVLVIGGIIVIGVFTATLTSVFFGEESDELKIRQDEMEGQLRHLTQVQVK